MNCEELLESTKSTQKELGDTMKTKQKLSKNILKAMDGGDLKSCVRDIAALEEVCREYAAALARIKALVEGFDAKAYINGGDFANQLLGYCENAGLDIKGDFPVYEVFPYKVKVDTGSLDLYVDGKKTQCLRLQRFTQDLKVGRDKLMKASFNAAAFADELAEAYDVALLCQSKGKAYAPDADCYLTGLYKYLAPMSRYRRDYDKQSFAFDLARLYGSDVEQIKDGRKLQFGPAINNSKAIRILDADGVSNFSPPFDFLSSNSAISLC